MKLRSNRPRIRPVKATFQVLCRDEDDKEACERVKALMHDCKVSDAEPTAAYNHVGERKFDNIDDAISRMDELKRLASKDATDVTLRFEF